MIRKRTIGTLAALGGMTVALALLLGLPAAKADEVTQLQTNPDVQNPELAKRLDQLAQVGLPKPQEPAGSVATAGSFPRSILIPGTDTSLLVGGQIELDAGYWFTGGNNNNASAGSPIAGVPGLAGVPLSVPGNQARDRTNSIFNASVYASRLHIETRTPTAYGQAQTVLEFDFLGCSLGGIDCNNTVAGNDGLGARLRLAYGTLGPFAVGQMYGPGTDLAANPEALDLGCCAGTWGIGRLPQAVYTTEIWTPAGPASFQFSLYDPEDSAMTPQGQTLTNNTTLANVTLAGIPGLSQATTNQGLLSTLNGGSNQLIGTNPLKTSYPDPVAALNWQQPWGHLNLKALVHQAALVDGLHVNRQYLGYGGGVSGDVKPGWFGWQKDDITFTAFAGNGMGRYAGGGGSGTYFPYIATNYGAPATALGASVGNPLGYGHVGGATTAAAAAGVRAQTIPEYGAEISYQHWWAPTLRSTADFGVVHQDVNTALIGSFANGGPTGVNKELVNVHLNLIWSPVPFINTGFEYLWGHRQTVYNQKGDENILEFATVVKF